MYIYTDISTGKHEGCSSGLVQFHCSGEQLRFHGKVAQQRAVLVLYPLSLYLLYLLPTIIAGRVRAQEESHMLPVVRGAEEARRHERGLNGRGQKGRLEEAVFLFLCFRLALFMECAIQLQTSQLGGHMNASQRAPHTAKPHLVLVDGFGLFWWFGRLRSRTEYVLCCRFIGRRGGRLRSRLSRFRFHLRRLLATGLCRCC